MDWWIQLTVQTHIINHRCRQLSENTIFGRPHPEELICTENTIFDCPRILICILLRLNEAKKKSYERGREKEKEKTRISFLQDQYYLSDLNMTCPSQNARRATWFLFSFMELKYSWILLLDHNKINIHIQDWPVDFWFLTWGSKIPWILLLGQWSKQMN